MGLCFCKGKDLPHLKGESEMKIFFGDERDNDLSTRGWITDGDSFNQDGDVDHFPLPEGLESVAIEPDRFPEGTLQNFLVYNPEKAEVKIVFWKKDKPPEDKKVWSLVDSNVARGVYVRTKA